MTRMEPDTNRSDAMGGYEREPALDDMLTDPVTRALMASDGATAEEVKNLLAAARQRYRAATSRR
jgi:hypothetical protein